MAITIDGPVNVAGSKGTSSGQGISALTGHLPVVGDIFLTVMAIDNGGASGVPLDSTAAYAGSGGSVGTITDIVVNRTPTSSTNDGTTLLIAYAVVTSDFQNGNQFQYTWASGTYAVAHAYYVISGAASGHVNTASSTGSGTGPTVTTGTSPTRGVLSGDVVFGLVAVESATAITTGDTDTTNGSWATYTNASSGGTGGDASKQSLGMQHKTVNADGAQTYNPAITNADYAIAVLTFGPAARSLVIPAHRRTMTTR